MLQTHSLQKSAGASHRKKRLGRGNSSGRGTTAGRGTKGQLSRTGRGKIPAWFEGGQTTLAQKAPKRRGFRRAAKKVFAAVDITTLNQLDNGAVVTVALLQSQGLIHKKEPYAKILGNGELSKKLTVQVPCSASAKAKIEAAGGTVATPEVQAEKKKEMPKQ